MQYNILYSAQKNSRALCHTHLLTGVACGRLFRRLCFIVSYYNLRWLTGAAAGVGVVRMHCLMQADEVLAFCFNAFSHFVYVRLVLGLCVVLLIANCGSVSRFVCLYIFCCFVRNK